MENSRVNAAIGLAEAFYQPDADQLYFNYLTVKYDGSIFDNSIAEIQAQVQEMKKQFMDMDLLDIHYQRKIFHDLLEDIRGTDEIYAYFLDLIYQNEDLQSELEYIQNFKRFGEKTCKKMEQTYRGVVLITAHSSKGLEWPVVFNSITNYDSKALHTSSSRSDKVEEMRQLLFVSMTRARDLLWVTGQYVCYGKKDDQTYNQFLKEVMEANGDKYIPVDASAALRELDRKQKAARRRERQHAPTEEQKKAYAEITRGAKQMNLMDMLNAMAASR